MLITAAMRKQQKWNEANTAKEWKVTKLPRNGPKEGQSVESWQYGKTKGGDADWEKRKADAINRGKL